MKNIIYLILTILIFTSCEEMFTTVRELDIPDHKSKLAINTELSGDSLTIFIDHSKAIDDEKISKSIEANVSLLENGNEIINFDYFNIGGGNENILKKKLDNKIESGNEYTIIIDSKKFGVAKSSDIAPESAVIEKINYDTTTFRGEYGEYNKFSFILDDKKDVENYYLFKFQMIRGDNQNNYIYTSSNDTEIKSIYVNTTLSDENGYYFYGYSHLLSDKNFDGTKRKVRFQLSDGYYYEPGNEKYKIIFTVINITKTYYNFLTSFQQSEESEGNPFSEPVAVTGNIENGYGIFNVFSSKEYIIEVE